MTTKQALALLGIAAIGGMFALYMTKRSRRGPASRRVVDRDARESEAIQAWEDEGGANIPEPGVSSGRPM